MSLAKPNFRSILEKLNLSPLAQWLEQELWPYLNLIFTSDNKLKQLIGVLDSDNCIIPARLADADAANNRIYYSTTASKLVYKDSSGTVNALY